MMHYYELECHAEILVCFLCGQGHSNGSCDQNMTVSAICFELLILLQPNSVLWNSYYKPVCLVIKRITLLEVKATAKLLNVMNRWIVCYHTWYGDHHHEPESHAKRLLCCLLGQGHSKGLWSQNIIFCNIFWTTGPSGIKLRFDGTSL